MPSIDKYVKFTSHKSKYSLEDREKEFLRIRKALPGKIPIIVEPIDDKIPNIDRHKYLVSPDIMIGQFIYTLRSRIKVSSEQALFFMVNNKFPMLNELLSNLYEREKDQDGFLYIIYSQENTFG